ncbi:DUF2818 family protein [Noviherbaspirillum sp.]|uniref:DUF2818 family protein n=1 Tax=Noviherbaspirillum sp. TaxID=1926288 RepID=UPI002FDF9C50
MDSSFSSWLVILLAVVAANLPFFNERLFGVIPMSKQAKPLWMRLVELAALYGLVGIVAYMLEARIGNVFPQRWEFYAITICLFIVLAFPGFVFRYLSKRHS